jgi:hypothetical protein
VALVRAVNSIVFLDRFLIRTFAPGGAQDLAFPAGLMDRPAGHGEGPGAVRGGHGMLVNSVPASTLDRRERQRVTHQITAPERNLTLVANRDDYRRLEIEHSPRDQLMAGGTIAGREPQQIPIAGLRIGREPGRWQ